MASYRIPGLAGTVVALAVLLAGCDLLFTDGWPRQPASPSASPPGEGAVSLGQPVTLTSRTTTPGEDATFRESSEDSLIDGFSIVVPADAYAGPTTFTVTATPITASSLGALVTPVSHLFTIDAGGVEATVPVAVRIPARIPADAVAGAWFYDAASGSLEGVPAVARDEESMTVVTRHFSAILISIAEAGLPDTIDSGFRPELDTWQIPNDGAYPEPKGYCSGAATTAMWYFLERFRGAGASHLFGLYDDNGGTKTPTLWQDDAHAIRLATTVQHGTDWASLASRFFWRQGWIAGELAFDAFRYSIAVTGEPQLVFTRNATSSHAMIVYRVDSDRLWIADPNFPGEARSTTYDRATRTLAPYTGSEVFPTILYAAKSAIVPWSDLATAWAAFDGGTIGNDVFPHVEVFLEEGPQNTWAVPLESGYETDEPTVRISYSDDAPGGRLYTKYLGTAPVAAGVIDIPLAVGENELGVHLQLSVGTALEWAGFQRFTIIRTEPSPSPSPAGGGTWQLVAGPDQIFEQAPLGDRGWSSSGGPGEMESTVAIKDVEFSVKFTWVAPDVLVPGDPLDVGAKVGVKKRPEECDRDNGVCNFAAEIYAGLLVMYPPSQPQQGPQVVAVVNARGKKGQPQSQEIVPDYDPLYGPDMVLQIGITHADAQRWYQYVYEWDGPT